MLGFLSLWDHPGRSANLSLHQFSRPLGISDGLRSEIAVGSRFLDKAQQPVLTEGFCQFAIRIGLGKVAESLVSLSFGTEGLQRRL